MLYHCQVCGKPFDASPAAKRKFCSRKCMGVAKTKKVERVCHACGKSFLVRRYKVKEGRGLYCSRECADTGWDEPCDYCGKPVHRTPFHAGRFDNVFCSRQCYGDWNQDRVECKCQQCGISFNIKRSGLDDGKGKHCSINCYNITRTQEFITLACEQCGQDFEIPKSFVNPNMFHGRFCSNECRGIARRMPDSARSVYNHEFTPKLKRNICKRDGNKCYQCGKTRKEDGRTLAVHHIDYDKTNCHPSNLITLCHSCHSTTNYNRDAWLRHFTHIMEHRNFT